MTRRRRLWTNGLLGLLGLLLGLSLAVLLFPQQVLCVDSGQVQADVIVVLGGGAEERPSRAAELFADKAAPRIILTGSGDYESKKRLLVSAGVGESAIHVEAKSTSTKENAEFTVPMLRALGARRVIVVTSWYHSRRALNCFEHYAPDIEFYSRPSYYAHTRADWKREGVAGYVRSEYVKLLGYWVRWGISPF